MEDRRRSAGVTVCHPLGNGSRGHDHNRSGVTNSSYPGWSLQGLLLAVLAVAVPVTAVLTRTVLLGPVAASGLGACLCNLVLAIWMSWYDYNGTSQGMWFVMLTLAAMAGPAPIVHRSRGAAA